MTFFQVASAVLMGTLVGLDLASVPQAMYSRPLIAGLLGGVAVGNPLPGLFVGALLELFAMDVLPVGASRYPDWGPGAVAAGALAGGHEAGILASGLLGVVLVAVVAAWAGGWLTHLVRRANVHSVEVRRVALDAGDRRAIRAIQRFGLLRDTIRSFALTSLALALGDLLSALFARDWPGPQRVAQIVLAATSIGVALHGGSRLTGRGRQALWFAGGLAAGVVMVTAWLR